jgi:hypothetical protein
MNGFRAAADHGDYNYRRAYVSGTTATLNFFPEVWMRAWLPSGVTPANQTDAITHNGVATPYELTVLGEQRRSVTPSSLNIVRVNTGDVTGRITSDMFATGTRARELSDANFGLPVAFSGANVNMRADSTWNMTVTGFSLDLIASDEATGERGFTGNPNFNNGTWGNNNDRNARQAEFTTWTRNFARSVGVSAYLESDGVPRDLPDFRLSFAGVSVGTVNETGMYHLEFRNGAVVENAERTRLINDIIAAHGGEINPIQAWDIFFQSDVGRSLIRAVESRGDNGNGSAALPSAMLGGTADQNWYDEVVRTFVIRRFETTLEVGTVTLTDKLDYAWSPPANNRGSTGSGADANLHSAGDEGQWFITFYLGSTTGLGFRNADRVYNPGGNTGTNIGSRVAAIADGTVIVQRLHITGANFVISNSTTSDARQ